MLSDPFGIFCCDDIVGWVFWKSVSIVIMRVRVPQAHCDNDHYCCKQSKAN